MSRENYHPSKQTAFALCVALHLSYEESKDLIRLANYSFSTNNRYDLIFSYILKERIYDMDTINEFLDYYGYPCLGER